MTSVDQTTGAVGNGRKSEGAAADPDVAARQRLADLAARRSRPTRVAGSSVPADTPGMSVPIGSTNRRPTRRHPALATRILTAGLSTTVMLGIIADLAANATPTSTDDATSTAPAVTVISSTASNPAVVVTQLSGQPIHLTAAPAIGSVQTGPVQQSAPVVKTHGSR
ncbi:MAG: hypothetical protein HKN03_13140 [Acidimicrobiales bacterium]|nr:hypothetical protein [Acidimicrobiales bacterium]